MDFIDLIEKKKLGKAHTKEEINFITSSLMDTLTRLVCSTTLRCAARACAPTSR